MKLAGVKHHSSYEWNSESNRTHNLNFGTHNAEVDIRTLGVSSLPKPGSISIIVGSPPCTQFSFSNRGGKGDIEDGLVDLHKFLSTVQYLKPKYWAMENVPRVSKIIGDLVKNHTDFQQFEELITFNEIVDSSDFGVPQKRKRMICGNFPFDRFLSYKVDCPRYTMDEVLAQLSANARKDKLYGWTRGKITDNEKELPLSEEEVRMNREAKQYHPVYNKMSFPDPRDKPARTVTSLCTRVSRESIVIEDGDVCRRLTVRERGALMGFPVSYQFYGNSYGSKLKMIGNAIPPPLTYHIFNAMLEKEYSPLRSQKYYTHKIPSELTPSTPPPIPKQRFQPNRNYRMCVTGYRYGSGVRFELSNQKSEWRVRFFYGSSTSIHELLLDEILKEQLVNLLPKKSFLKLPERLENITSESIQTAWVGGAGTHPFTVSDRLGLYGAKIESFLAKDYALASIIKDVLPGKLNRSLTEEPKKTIAGLILGIAFNESIAKGEEIAN